MKRPAAIAALLLGLTAMARAGAPVELPVSPEQTAEIGKRCKAEIDQLSEALGDGPISIADDNALHDAAVSQDASVINQRNLATATAELAAMRRSGEGGAMIEMNAALICVIKQRLNLAKGAGYTPGPATAVAPAVRPTPPECATLQAQFDRSQGQRQRFRDERESGRYLANKLSGDKLLMDLNDLRKSAVKLGCSANQVDAMKAEIKDLRWVIEHTTRF